MSPSRDVPRQLWVKKRHRTRIALWPVQNWSQLMNLIAEAVFSDSFSIRESEEELVKQTDGENECSVQYMY